VAGQSSDQNICAGFASPEASSNRSVVPPLRSTKTAGGFQSLQTFNRFAPFKSFKNLRGRGNFHDLGILQTTAGGTERQTNSRLCDDFAVLPNIDRRAMHACGLAGDFCGAAQCAADRSGELLGSFFTLVFFMVLVPRVAASGLSYQTRSTRRKSKMNYESGKPCSWNE
jgi:hypothetical protein